MQEYISSFIIGALAGLFLGVIIAFVLVFIFSAGKAEDERM